NTAGGLRGDDVPDRVRPLVPVAPALTMPTQISEGLAYVHGQCIIHRDIKPGNVWLTREGTAKLGDFGLAVALDRSRLTMAGTMVGTASSMPPQQALGAQADARSDP